MNVDKVRALLNEAKSINAGMGKIAVPCMKCFWSERTPECVDNDWHKHDDINQKLHEALELLSSEANNGQVD